MKLKLLSIATLVAISGSGSALASSNTIPVGPNLGYGDASNNHTIFSTVANPSWVGGNLHEENNYGIGLSIGVRIKQNDFSTLNNQYKADVKPLLENFDNNPFTALAKATEIKDNLNTLLLDTRDSFYAQQDFVASLPIVATNNELGGLGFELSGSAIGRQSILAGDTPINLKTAYLTNNPTASVDDMIANGLDINTAIYIKTVTTKEAAINYGHQFFENQHGRLSVGVRAKMIQANLVKSISNLDKYLTAASRGDDISEQLDEDLKKHTDISDTDTNFGVDIGAQWFAENWMAGLSLMNINSPTFKYNPLGETNDEQGASERVFANHVSLKEEVELAPQARIEGAVYSENRHWSAAASYDLNSAKDLVSQEYQWATISVAYAADASGSWVHALIPDVRLGYRTNLAGDQRSYITPGFTWGPLNLDLGFANFDDIGKAISGDPDEIPEAFMANIGLEVYF